jgi:hypothetical protein
VKFVPKSSMGSGGTRFGNSYLNLWANCPRKWFNSHYRPVELDGEVYRGIAPRWTSENLLRGSLFHEGLAEWYRSGVRDGEDTGERDVDRALAVIQKHAHDRSAEWPDEGARDVEVSNTQILLRRYHDHFALGGAQPEFPQVRVACDGSGQPLIEREWEFSLGEGHVYTCRTDAIIYYRGVLVSLEHKTSAVPWMRLKTIPMDSQFAGEQFVLRNLFPEDPISGTLVNVVGTKKAAGKFDRELTKRTDHQLLRWRDNCVSILNQIQVAKMGFEVELQRGVSIERAADMWFPDHGTRTDHCTAYSGCEFLDLCQWAGREDSKLGMYTKREAA